VPAVLRALPAFFCGKAIYDRSLALRLRWGETRNGYLISFRTPAQTKNSSVPDKKRMKEAVAAGACTLSEWKRFSAVSRPKQVPAHRN